MTEGYVPLAGLQWLALQFFQLTFLALFIHSFIQKYWLNSFSVTHFGCWARFSDYQYKHSRLLTAITQFVGRQIYKYMISVQRDTCKNSKGGSEFRVINPVWGREEGGERRWWNQKKLHGAMMLKVGLKGNTSGWHLFSSCYVPGTTLRVLHVLTHLIRKALLSSLFYRWGNMEI